MHQRRWFFGLLLCCLSFCAFAEDEPPTVVPIEFRLCGHGCRETSTEAMTVNTLKGPETFHVRKEVVISKADVKTAEPNTGIAGWELTIRLNEDGAKPLFRLLHGPPRGSDCHRRRWEGDCCTKRRRAIARLESWFVVVRGVSEITAHDFAKRMAELFYGNAAPVSVASTTHLPYRSSSSSLVT